MLKKRDASGPLPLPPAETVYTIGQLARAVGVVVRTIRYYVKRGALEAPPFRSKNTRYDRAFLIRLRAVVALRQKGLRLDAIRAKLGALSPQDLLLLAGYSAPAPAQGEAGSPRALAPGFLGPYRVAGATPERWEHFAICPGVKLLVRSEADGEAWRVAREIVATFGLRQA